MHRVIMMFSKLMNEYFYISICSFKRVKLCISCVLPNVCLHKKDFCVKGKNIFRNDSNWLISWIILSNWQFLVVRRAMTWKRNYIVLIGFLTSFWQSRLNKCLYVLILSIYCKSMFQCFIIIRYCKYFNNLIKHL